MYLTTKVKKAPEKWRKIVKNDGFCMQKVLRVAWNDNNIAEYIVQRKNGKNYVDKFARKLQKNSKKMGKIDNKWPKMTKIGKKKLIFSVKMCVSLVEIVIANGIKIIQAISNAGKATKVTKMVLKWWANSPLSSVESSHGALPNTTIWFCTYDKVFFFRVTNPQLFFSSHHTN